MTEDIAALADRLARIPTTIACDILKGEPLAERVATGLSPMTPNSAMAGPVRIIAFLPGRPELRKPGPPANFAIIDAVTPGEVLVLCAGGSTAGAVLGDMLATRAHQLGARGAVVDGAVRDLDGLALSGLPVQARGVAPMAAHASLIPFACSTPARFAGVTVMPGDWVLADRDGTLFLTRALVDILLAQYEAAIARDEFSRQLLLMGFALTEVFPLPPSLGPLLGTFHATRQLPLPEQIRAALASLNDD
ncbi:MAG: RraA family protein [Candidatus Saccharibacteria bacterium]|nr:RraA family protein [Pseudorhodobacter sp.]